MAESKSKSLGNYGAEIVRGILVSQDLEESKRLFNRLRCLETQNIKG